MKKTDIQVSGSEYNARARKAICEVEKCIENFCSIINTTLLLEKIKNADELSFALYLTRTLKNELLKIKASVDGYIETELMMHIVTMVKRIEMSNCFRGVCFINAVRDPMNIIRKSMFCKKLYDSFLLCSESIKSCRISAGLIFDYRSISWDSDSVLVGSLRNREQLNVALENGFYHIPAHMIPDDKLNVSYIAIYQSKNFFGKDAGIRYFARVLSVEKVVRRDIRQIPSDSDELYYVFNVSRWNSLDKPIGAERGGALFNFTNLYMLMRAETADELYFSNEREYKLYGSIKVSLSGGYNKVATSYGDAIIAIDDGKISVYKNDRLLYAVSVSDYEKNPVRFFRSILKLCK